jgi:hypothetical protein
MADITDRLGEWRSAGLITAKQVKDIAAFERQRAAPGAAPQGRAAPVAEAIGYVGAVIAVAAVGILLGDRWSDLNFGGRLAIVGLLTLIVAGAAFTLRGNPREPIQRLVSVLAVAALGGVAWLTVIIATETTEWRAENIALTVSLVVFAFAVPLYLFRRRAFPQLAVFVSLLVLVGTVFARPAFSGGLSWGAIAVWAAGAAWVLLALGGWHKPAELAILTGSAAAIIGAATAAAGDGRSWLLWLGLATAAALMWRGVIIDEFLMVALGAIGVLIFVPQIVLEYFPEGSKAIVAMLITGLLLVVFAVGIARGRRGHDAVDEKEARS